MRWAVLLLIVLATAFSAQQVYAAPVLDCSEGIYCNVDSSELGCGMKCPGNWEGRCSCTFISNYCFDFSPGTEVTYNECTCPAPNVVCPENTEQCALPQGQSCASDADCCSGLLCLAGACAPPTQCSDGTDNDGDGQIDYPNDPNCDSRSDNDETSLPQCSDLIDNDGDGQIDYPNDPDCTSSTDDKEAPDGAGIIREAANGGQAWGASQAPPGEDLDGALVTAVSATACSDGFGDSNRCNRGGGTCYDRGIQANSLCDQVASKWSGSASVGSAPVWFVCDASHVGDELDAGSFRRFVCVEQQSPSCGSYKFVEGSKNLVCQSSNGYNSDCTAISCSGSCPAGQTEALFEAKSEGYDWSGTVFRENTGVCCDATTSCPEITGNCIPLGGAFENGQSYDTHICADKGEGPARYACGSTNDGKILQGKCCKNDAGTYKFVDGSDPYCEESEEGTCNPGQCSYAGTCYNSGQQVTDCRVCNNGVIQAQSGTACSSDGNACTNDFCSAGVCTHTPVACSGERVCSAGACVEACSDTLDNDNNGEADHDGLWSGQAMTMRGDVACPVQVTGIEVSSASISTPQACSQDVIVTCSADPVGVRSYAARLGGVECEPDDAKGWHSGNKYDFICDVPATEGTHTAECYVDTSISYQTGSNPKTDIEINCQRTVHGRVRGALNIPIEGAKVTGENAEAATDALGFYSLGDSIPLGLHEFTADAEGYYSSTVQADILTEPETVDFVLDPWHCNEDGTFGESGTCSLNCMDSIEVSLNVDPADEQRLKEVCAGAPVASQRDFNSTHIANCCIGPLDYESEFEAPLKLTSCARQLIPHTTLVEYNGKIHKLTVLTYKKCE